MARLNAHLPDSYGLSLTVYAPTASETNPINSGDVLVWDRATGWGVVPAGDGAAIEVIAKHPVTDPYTPLGVWAFGFTRVHDFPAGGVAIGDVVVYDGAGGVRVAADTDTAATGLVVNIENGIAQVLLP